MLEERQRQCEIKAIKDKLAHNLYKNGDDIEELRQKESEVKRTVEDKMFE